MARNGSGTFTRIVPAYVFDTVISETSVNSEMDDIATALTASLAKDGQTTPTANLPMGTYRHTGVGTGTARTDYAALGQVQDGSANWVDGGGTADAITATYSPALTALVDGQLCFVRATLANATTTPTFNPSGLGAGTIVKGGGTALVPGDIRADGHELVLRYNLANTRWELLNVAPGDVAEFIPNVVADGSTDNHAVIQAAVDAAIAAGGGRVLLPAGSIVVTQAIAHYGPAPVTIVGAGAGATVLRAAASFDAVIKLEGTAYGSTTIVGSTVTAATAVYPGKYASAPTVTILGDGTTDPTASCTIDANGRIDSVTVNAGGSTDHTEAYVAFGTSTIPSLGFVLEDLSISTTGTTGAVLIGKTAWQFFFSRCHFSSTAAVTLFDTYGDFGNIADCSFSVANASGVNFHIRGRMIDSSIHHCRFGNTCSGVKISTDYQSALVASSDRPQGITFTDCHMYSTGAYNLYASESLFLTFVGCWFTEGGTNQILMDNKATNYIFNSCYIGGSAGLTAVRIKKDVGNSVMFSSCFFNYSTIAILVEADADEKLDTLHVVGCGFQNATVCCLDMDSVTHAVIIGNIDRGTPSAGSWNTRSTHASSFGEYQFDNNAWHTVTPATFSTAAAYYWGRDTGIVMRNKGTYAATTTTSASQAHGMSRTPTWCQGTPTINTGAIWNSVKNATNIGFTWVTSGSPSLHWEAEV